MSDQAQGEGPSQPDYATLARLFDEDPLKLTDQDLDHIIVELRKGREAYLATGTTTKQSKAAGKKKEVSKEAQDLLSDLGLD